MKITTTNLLFFYTKIDSYKSHFSYLLLTSIALFNTAFFSNYPDLIKSPINKELCSSSELSTSTTMDKHILSLSNLPINDAKVLTGTGATLYFPGLSNIQCNDNGTTTDATDDFFTFDLNPVGINTGSGYTIIGATVTPAGGLFGGPTSFATGSGSAGAGSLSPMIRFGVNLDCDYPIFVTDPGTCSIASSTCSITDVGLSNVQCNDNGTATDPTDDYITFDLSPTGTNIGSTYSVLSGSGSAISPLSGSGTSMYGSVSSYSTQPDSAGNGNVIFTITDGSDPSCMLAGTITNPGSCSIGASCVLYDVVLINGFCYDNATVTDPFDDYVTFDLSPTGEYLGTSYTVTGGPLSPTSGNYGVNTTFTTPSGMTGPFNLQITDDTDSNCSITLHLPGPNQCSFDFSIFDPTNSTNPTNQMFMAFDPCSCNGDQVLSTTGTVVTAGTFLETVTVMGPPGLNLQIGNVATNTGFLDDAGNPLPLPILMTESSAGHYEVTFNHREGAGYDIQQFEFSTVTNPTLFTVVTSAPFTPVTITNACAYPKIICNPTLPATINVSDSPVNLGVALNGVQPAFTPLGGYPQFLINGQVAPSNRFNPATTPVRSGNNSVISIYDIVSGPGAGGTVANPAIPLDIDGNASNGVCPVRIQKTINVTGIPSIPTMSEWGLAIFGLILLNLGVGFIGRKEDLVANI